MSPTFNHGDVLLVRWFNRVKNDLRLGTVVVIERDEMPGVFFIKRIEKSHNGLYWVVGDNTSTELQQLMHDSKRWGYIPAHEVKGKVLLRLKKTSGQKPQR